MHVLAVNTLDLTALPEEFAAGTTVTYLKTIAGYSPATWTLKLYLAGAKAASFDGVTQGSGWLVTLAASATEELTAGAYSWTERLEKTGPVRQDIASGLILVTPDIANAGDGDFQSWAEKTLPLVESAIAGRFPGGIASYQIAGRALSKIPLPELLQLRTMLLNQIAQVKKPTRLSKPVLISFPPVGNAP